MALLPLEGYTFHLLLLTGTHNPSCWGVGVKSGAPASTGTLQRLLHLSSWSWRKRAKGTNAKEPILTGLQETEEEARLQRATGEGAGFKHSNKGGQALPAAAF